jgi:hypothetical protein
MKFIYFTIDGEVQKGIPEPIKKFIPKWYKDAETTYVSSEDGSGEESPGLKKCAPFLDALTSGYTLVTPFDIFIGRKENGEIDIVWNSPRDQQNFVMERPKESGSTMPRPAGHLPNHLVWSNKWGFKVSKGYSVLITHPLNRFDLPFTTMSGIMESDKLYSPGNIPFFIKEDFTGVIPEGTPYAQIIPIKRNSWKMVVTKANKALLSVQGNMVRKESTNYKKKFWVKKEYN